MVDDSSTSAASVEAAALRRRWVRWLTLGEILGVAAIGISAATLWNSWSERRHAEEEKLTASAKADKVAKTLVLTGKADRDGETLTLSAVGGQAIQAQTITFPSALGLFPVDSSDPRIDRRWFASALKKRLSAEDDTARPHGDARLPVAITTRFYSDGDIDEDVSLYDVGYATSSGFLGSTEVKLRGLSLIRHGSSKGAQARIDALWATRHPAKTQKP